MKILLIDPFIGMETDPVEDENYKPSESILRILPTEIQLDLIHIKAAPKYRLWYNSYQGHTDNIKVTSFLYILY